MTKAKGIRISTQGSRCSELLNIYSSFLFLVSYYLLRQRKRGKKKNASQISREHYLSEEWPPTARACSFSNNSLAAFKVRRTEHSSAIVSNFPEVAESKIPETSSIPEKSKCLETTASAAVV